MNPFDLARREQAMESVIPVLEALTAARETAGKLLQRRRRGYDQVAEHQRVLVGVGLFAQIRRLERALQADLRRVVVPGDASSQPSSPQRPAVGARAR